MTGEDPAIRIGEEVEKYLENPRKVLKQVERFRRELDSNLRKVVEDSESGIENTLVDHSRQPEVYPVFTPEETEVGEDRLLVALSISLFELANPSDNPLHEKLKSTQEAATGRTAEGLLNGFRQGNFDWSAKYEKADNSVLFNELPAEVLPDSSDAPSILAFLWNALNTRVDAGVDRNYGIGMKTLETRVVHEMTHALNTQAADPLANRKTAAVDEAAAMASTYAVAGKMPGLDGYYQDAGIKEEELRQARQLFAGFADRKGHDKQTVSLIRNASIRAIKQLEPGTGEVAEAVEKSLKKL